MKMFLKIVRVGIVLFSAASGLELAAIWSRTFSRGVGARAMPVFRLAPGAGSAGFRVIVMHSGATVKRTDTPGRYRVEITPDMGGDWTANLSFEGPQGPSETSFTVNVKP